MHEIPSVIDDYIRPEARTFLIWDSYSSWVAPYQANTFRSLMGQGGSHIILGGKRVAPSNIHVRPSGSKSLAQICRLCFKMDGKGDLQSL